uniref:Uncharacterized protein n=1 Tax=Coccidioides posadasii RMSCC 3488 TaxID=454284 RepID=A0A0J6FFX4_COCPO|nr:hypothetical protein CPAG_04556 [Coccidioides posadasii RMSCC 3488]
MALGGWLDVHSVPGSVPQAQVPFRWAAPWSVASYRATTLGHFFFNFRYVQRDPAGPSIRDFARFRRDGVVPILRVGSSGRVKHAVSGRAKGATGDLRLKSPSRG